MPYIKPDERKILDEAIARLDDIITGMNCGNMNYAITSVCHMYLKHKGITYTNLNEVMGILSCVQQEFYRRVVAEYENKKILDNGDLTIL